MKIEKLAQELADLRFETGYRFENGASFRETLGLERAKGLLKALGDRGYVLTSQHVDSPSISEGDHQDHELAQ